MQYSSALIAAVAFGFANAVSFTNSAFNGITAGQPITLTWKDAVGPVTITLKNGASTNLQTVSTVASGQTSGSYTWNVPSTLTQDTYALEIQDSNPKPNYSSQFELIGGAAPTASASSSSVLSSVSSAASSASSSVSSVLSSVQSSLSSVIVSATNTSSSNTAAPTTTGVAGTNSTTTAGSSTTGSATKASTTGASKTSSSGPSSSTAVVPNSNSAAEMASPLALVFLTFAAILSLN